MVIRNTTQSVAQPAIPVHLNQTPVENTSLLSRVRRHSSSMRNASATSRLAVSAKPFQQQADEAFRLLEANLKKQTAFKVSQKNKDAISTLKAWAADAQDRAQFEKRHKAAQFLMRKDCRLSNGYLKISGGIKIIPEHNFELPPHLHLSNGSLIVDDENLEELPDDLKIDGALIADKTKLKSLGNKLWVGSDLNIEESKVEHLPQDVHIGRTLNAGKTPLQALPEKMRLTGSLYIYETQVKQLPKQLYLGRTLNISKTDIDHFPQDMTIGGDIFAFKCEKIKELPQHLQNLGKRFDFKIRTIDIAETSIPKEQIASLPISAAKGVHYIDTHNIKEHRMHKTLDEAIQSWATATRKIHVSAKKWELNALDKDEFNLFLSRLHTTNDALNPTSRVRHIDRVQTLIQELDQNKFDFRRYASAQIHNGLESCEDRIMHTLNILERQILVNKARGSKHPERELKELSKQFMALEYVRKSADQHCIKDEDSDDDDTPNIDEIEVHLFFEVKCREALNLPVKTQTMKFERFAHVPQEDINKCIKETKAKLSDKTLVKAYEDSWDPLQQFYREKELKALKWKNLEVEQHNYTPDDCCLLSSEELKDMKQPVLLRGTLYDLKTLGTFWVDKGYDPTTTVRFSLKDLKRPA
ncbi:MAG: NEL-type E3 ubiquitin ligase domain-containing protein [Pseudomonadota bacterium]|nr:NEL-type E3 ubiquitin ligase domain-containing protein [Pseudomonadota bacterium]